MIGYVILVGLKDVVNHQRYVLYARKNNIYYAKNPDGIIVTPHVKVNLMLGWMVWNNGKR